MTWLSIITVVRNEATGLRRTRESLQRNDLNGVEWFVIDSSDNHTDVESIVAGHGQYEWVEPTGIYPAMNRGLEGASGDFVLFLNAGDELHSPQTLKAVREILSTQPCSWAYGQIEIVEESETTVVTPTWDFTEEMGHFFARGHFPPHQATFVRASDLRSLGGFDTSYQITADYKVFLELTQDSRPVILPLVVARFSVGGASSQHWLRSLHEFHRARTEVLHPRGSAAVRECALTLAHAVRLGTYRWVLAPARRFARR